jgi:hypothetical protein
LLRGGNLQAGKKFANKRFLFRKLKLKYRRLEKIHKSEFIQLFITGLDLVEKFKFTLIYSKRIFIKGKLKKLILIILFVFFYKIKIKHLEFDLKCTKIFKYIRF